MKIKQAAKAGGGAIAIALTIAAALDEVQAQTLPSAQQQTATTSMAAPSAMSWSRLYGGAEYLHWWVKDAPLSVPLVSTGPDQNKEGFLINSNSTILYGAPFAPATGGNDKQSFPGFSGGRFTLGYWLDDAQRYAVEGRAFLLQSRTAGFAAQGDANGNPGMRVPVFNNVPYAPGGMVDTETGLNLVPQTEDGVPISLPDEVAGGVRISNSLQFGGADLTGVISLFRGPSWEVSGLAGATFLQLSEAFNLRVNLTGVPTSAMFGGQSGWAVDEFKTRNRFYGATLGLRGRYSYGPVFVEGSGRVSFGASQEVLTVHGGYVDFGTQFASSSGPYGIFAMPANSGTFSQTHFAVAPEVQAKIGYDFTPSVAVTVGYDLLYISNVIRPGDQINRNIPKGQTFQQDGTAASLTSPAKLFKTTDFLAQGISVGMTFRF